MRITGQAALHAPGTRAWAALTDPAVLERAIPGCETLEPLPPAAARLTLTAAVAATAGIYTGRIRVTGRVPPETLVIEAALAGEPGTITGTVRLRLAESGGDGATQVSYEADADVAGELAAVGRSLLAAAAARLATQFFESVDELLAAHPERTATGAVPREAEASRIPGVGVALRRPALQRPPARASAPGAGTPRPPAGGRDMGASASRKRDFVSGAIAGTAIGIAAAKLGTLIARRNR